MRFQKLGMLYFIIVIVERICFDNAYYVGNEENPYRLLVKAIDYDIITCEIHKDTNTS